MVNQLKSIHPFPARMAPNIVWDHLPSSKGKLKILDPMVGSGTTTTIARLLGHEAYGIDTDPLAVMIASAWSMNIDEEHLAKKSHELLLKAKKMADMINSEAAYPNQCDFETREFISYWFDTISRKQLTALSYYIGRLRNESDRIIFWTAFSRMIITKSKGVSLAMDVSHSRPHKVYQRAPIKPFDLFPIAIKTILDRAPFKSNIQLPLTNISNGDSRKLPFVDNFFDIIITSPPYLNAIDYFRASKLSLVWMGNSVEKIQKWRKDNIGSENMGLPPEENYILNAVKKMGNLKKLPSREQGFTFRYLRDMNNVLSEAARVSKIGAKVILVVGNSTLKNVYINNSSGIIELAAGHKLSLVQKNKREIPTNRRYLPSPSNDSAGKELKSRMRHEVVIELRKD